MIENILFIDTETVPLHETEEEMYEKNPELGKLWETKVENSSKELTWDTWGALFPEFNKIVCISYGMYKNEKIKVKALVGSNEEQILAKFYKLLLGSNSYNITNVCAFNGENFDIPGLCKKFIKYNLLIPSIINPLGKKPWETSLIDPFKQWKFGSYGEQSASLDLICNFLNIESPKSKMHGSDVKEKYFKEGEQGLQDIGEYCNGDVISLIQFFARYNEGLVISNNAIEDPKNLEIFN